MLIVKKLLIGAVLLALLALAVPVYANLFDYLLNQPMPGYVAAIKLSIMTLAVILATVAAVAVIVKVLKATLLGKEDSK